MCCSLASSICGCGPLMPTGSFKHCTGRRPRNLCRCHADAPGPRCAPGMPAQNQQDDDARRGRRSTIFTLPTSSAARLDEAPGTAFVGHPGAAACGCGGAACSWELCAAARRRGVLSGAVSVARGRRRVCSSACSYPCRSRPQDFDLTASRGPRGGRYFIYRPPPGQ